MTMVATVSYQPGSSLPIVPRAADLAQGWLDEITDLYLLCFLLTADKMMAEQLFADAMDEYVGSPAAASGAWARGQGRASVIRRAIQVIRPVPKQAQSWSSRLAGRPLVSSVHEPFSAITSLGTFERFVFVLSVIEGESDETCAALLACDLAEVERSRDLAMTLISATEKEDGTSMLGDAVPAASAVLHLQCAIC